MLVSLKSAKRCCKYCYPDFGHVYSPKAKAQLRRTIKRRERQAIKKNIEKEV